MSEELFICVCLLTRAVKQMAKEVEILRGLRHKNIISICAVVFEEGSYGIVLEYMKYGGLDSFLSELEVPLLYKVQLSFDVALGMNYLHTLDKPIIHGDLKIQNVLVADGYTAKVGTYLLRPIIRCCSCGCFMINY